jgi:hypothetical protein
VYKALLVHVPQSLGHLVCDHDRLTFWKSSPHYEILEVAVLDVLHRDVQVLVIVEPAQKADEVLLVLWLV